MTHLWDIQRAIYHTLLTTVINNKCELETIQRMTWLGFFGAMLVALLRFKFDKKSSVSLTRSRWAGNSRNNTNNIQFVLQGLVPHVNTHLQPQNKRSNHSACFVANYTSEIWQYACQHVYSAPSVPPLLQDKTLFICDTLKWVSSSWLAVTRHQKPQLHEEQDLPKVHPSPPVVALVAINIWVIWIEYAIL